MAANSKIGWTTHTINFWWGCNKVSKECRHCYIENIMKRAGREPFGGPIRTKNWDNAYRFNRWAERQKERPRVFTCSMSDFFHPGADEWRLDAWRVIRECRNLDWLILTKRPELVMDRLPPLWEYALDQVFNHVWLGVTCGHPSSLWRIDALRAIPAALKFVSAEPLLAPLDLRPYLADLDWVITGCERAAKGKRTAMDLAWVRDIDAQCKEARVTHFFKQAYVNERGVPDERPLLDGNVVQDVPRSRVSLEVFDDYPSR